MLRNYLITAYKVLLRRKFFTFVNLFAVALTLAVLTVVVAFLQSYLEPLGAEHRSDHYLAVEDAMLTMEGGGRTWTSSLGYRMVERHLLTLEEPDLIAFFRKPEAATIFVGGRKLTPELAGTDANYWRILDFEFLAGRPISESDVEEGRFVAVVNETTVEEIFGSDGAQAMLGRSFVANGQRFEVVGVVADVPALRRHAFSEVWVPFSTAPSTSFRQEWMGSFNVLLYAEDKAKLDRIADEVWASFEGFVHDDPEQFQIAKAPPNTKLDALARGILGRRFDRDSRAGLFLLYLGLGMLAFMLLPSINLINLNVSRILERSSEIGIRKAFGASSRDLVRQFLVENLVLSILGGLVGFGLGVVLLRIVEGSGMIPYARFEIDLGVFLAALGLIVVFGLLSGVFPAYKMAKYNPVRALRGG